MIDQINALLPQTQCRQCGYSGCKPYATAIAAGLADINQCPPGGAEGIADLANLLGVAAKPLNPKHGHYKPKSVAVIIEADCIGCVKCIAACPVDAILGAAKLMHTVLAAECTGCELCIAPCPVDCIVMQPLPATPEPHEKRALAQHAQHRYEAKILRIEQENRAKAERLQQKKAQLQKTT